MLISFSTQVTSGEEEISTPFEQFPQSAYPFTADGDGLPVEAVVVEQPPLA